MRKPAHVIVRQAKRTCELCLGQHECRPYGPKGEQVCFECGMKDEEAAKRAFTKRLNGDA